MTLLRGLYAITPDQQSRQRPLTEMVDEALAGGARIVQYRDKGVDDDRRHAEASTLLQRCRQAGALLIINDDLKLASRIAADGIHLGRDDADPHEARLRLGPHAIIGISCYNRFEHALKAQEIGADYVAFGRFFPSGTKPDAVQADQTLLRRARRELHLPVVAIGGITPENSGPLITAGADMLAVVNSVFGAADIRAAAQAITELYSEET